MRVVNGAQVYGEPNVFVDQEKLDHAAAVEEVGRIADRESVGGRQKHHVFMEAIVLARTEVNDRTAFSLGNVSKPADMDGTIVDELICGQIVDGLAHRVPAEKADIERGVGIQPTGLADEFAEVQQVGSFDIVLRGLGRLRDRCGDGNAEKKKRDGERRISAKALKASRLRSLSWKAPLHILLVDQHSMAPNEPCVDASLDKHVRRWIDSEFRVVWLKQILSSQGEGESLRRIPTDPCIGRGVGLDGLS